MSETLITPEIEARIERRIAFANEDGNLMRANWQQSQYVEDVEILQAEITRLQAVIIDKL